MFLDIECSCFHLFILAHCFLIQTGRAGSHCKSIASSELSLSIKGLETVVSVLFSNTRTHLLYNEWEIFNTAQSEADHWHWLVYAHCWLIVFSFKQVAREATVSVLPAVNSNWILKGLETVSLCFVFKYTHLLTVQWTQNFQYCTQLRFVQYWKFLIHCTVNMCVYLKTKNSQQSLTHECILINTIKWQPFTSSKTSIFCIIITLALIT